MFKKFKSIFTIVVLSLIAIIAVACGSNSSNDVQKSDDSKSNNANNSEEADDGQVYTIRYPIVGTEDHPSFQALLDLEDELAEMSDGKIKLELYPNGQLFPDERETNEAIQLGNAEMTSATTASLSGFHKKFKVFDLPYLFDSREEVFETLDGEFGDNVADGLEDIGLVSMGYQENGFRHIINDKHEVKTVNDVKGLKFRVLPSDVYQDTMNLMGADASPLAFGELYSALQQGTYDGFESTIDLLHDNKFYEVQEYLTLTSIFFAPVILIMNKDFYDSMPADLQEVMNEWTDKVNKKQRELMAEGEDFYITELEKEMEVYEPTEEETQTFKDAVQPIYEKYEDEIGKDLIDEVLNK